MRHVAAKNSLSLMRFVLFFYFLRNLAFLFVVIPQPESKHLISYYGGQNIFIVLVWFFGYIRRKGGFYIPVFSEMTEDIYMKMSVLTFFATKYLYRSFLPGFSVAISFIDTFIFIVLAVSLAMSYQGRTWTIEEKERRTKRVEHLFKKANLSIQEREAIIPLLADSGRTKQRTPTSWKIFQFVAVAIVIGATIDAYSGAIATIIEKSFPFPDILTIVASLTTGA